jgi:hypothetical protein
MKKHGFLWAGIAAIAILFIGCASQPAKSGYQDGHRPLTIVSSLNESSEKTGTLTSRVWLGLFGEVTYPSISETAKQSGITKIATVEYYNKRGILNLWVDYTTVVTGE